MDILRLALSLVQFLEASATSCQDAGPKRKLLKSGKMLCNSSPTLKANLDCIGKFWGS